eukprot:3249950-Rhodomonas_salina.2
MPSSRQEKSVQHEYSSAARLVASGTRSCRFIRDSLRAAASSRIDWISLVASGGRKAGRLVLPVDVRPATDSAASTIASPASMNTRWNSSGGSWYVVDVSNLETAIVEAERHSESRAFHLTMSIPGCRSYFRNGCARPGRYDNGTQQKMA